MIPKEIRHYQIKSILAQGSDSIIYDAWDIKEDQACVLKQLHIHQLDAWKRLDLFKREAKILAHLEHPQIPYLRDYFIEDEGKKKSIYLVLEKVPGIPLSERVLDGWVLTEEECHTIAVQLLKILTYLHAMNPPVIHRDIKPSNLLLDEKGVLYLIDFGGVQESLKYEGSGGSTIIGTFGYMAPEQFTGRAVPQTDLYGVGSTLIFLLSAREPANIPQTDMLLNFRPYIDCSAVFANWIESLIVPSLKERFYSADAALNVLWDIMPGYTHHFTPPTFQTRKTHKRISVKELESTSITVPQETKETESNWGLKPGMKLRQRYLIKKVLGRGSVSITYAGYDQSEDLPVVIKELHFERMDNWKSFELFEREMKTMEQLRHPRMPKLLETFNDSEHQSPCFYIVSQKIEGLNLLEKLQGGWRPTEESIRELAQEILPLLIQLHEHTPRVIHRDIKPSNLMMNDKNEVYLIDFGAVQDLTQIKGGGGSTIIGTYGYMAPEQFTGNASSQSDIYSLGATLVHCLSGRSPSELNHDDFKLNFRPVVNCSENFAWWLEQLLAPQPEQRFKTAREALDTLNKLSNMIIQPLEATDLASEFDPTAQDKSIETTEEPNYLSFTVRSTMYDFKVFMMIIAGADLVVFPFLMGLPGIGPPLILLSILLETAVLLKIIGEGEKKTLCLELTPDMLRLNTYNNYKHIKTDKPITHLEVPLWGIQNINLKHNEIHNQLCIHVQHSSNSYPMNFKSQLPLASKKRQAEFILKKSQQFIERFKDDSALR